MTLVDSIASYDHRPRATVRIGGRRFYPLSIEVDHGFDVGTSQARIELSSEEAERLGTDFGNLVEINLGYDAEEVPAFRGFLEDDDPAYWPHGNVVAASGWMRRTRYEYPSEVTYENMMDDAIIVDLLERVGIFSHSIEGRGLTLGTVEPVVLKEGDEPLELIKRIDEATDYITFDSPDGTVRRRPNSGLPTASPAWTYVQGVNIFDVGAPRTTRDMRNKVVVTGLPQGDFTPSGTQQADNSYIPNPPQYVTDKYANDLFETDEACADKAARRLRRVNRIRREIIEEMAGNPLLYAGQTLGIQAEKVQLYTLQPYLVKHVTHNWRVAEFITRVAMEGGDADAGYPVTDLPDGGTPPEPSIELVVTAEAWEVAGTPTRFYTATGNGRGSYHPNREPGHIDFAWSNNKNADVSTTDLYSTFFTEAELATAEITLEVTDSDNSNLSKSLTVPVQAETVPIITKAMAVALDDILSISEDGGLTWTDFEAPFAGAPERRYTIVAELNRRGVFWAGAIGSSSLGTVAHWLVAIDLGASSSQDTPVFNFGAAAGKEITAIWVHERDDDRIIVGLQNGEVWATSNASAMQSAVWQLLTTLPARVEWLIESFDGWGQIRASAGESVYITYDSFAHYSELVDFAGGTAYRQALSPFGNYASGDLSPDAVVTEAGDAITLPGTPGLPILGLTHHIRRDILFAGDQDGQTYRKEEGATSFTAVGALSSGSPINHMLRDGDNPGALYLAADDGIYKSPNGADDWYKMLSWDGGTFPDRQGLRIGYSELPAPPSPAAPGGCISDFYIQQEFTGPGAGGESTHRMRVSRIGSGGTWQDEHAFANDGTWEIELVSLSDTPALYQGWSVHAVRSVGGDENLGQLENPGDTVALEHASGPAFDHFYLHLDDFDERLPQSATFKVCRTNPPAGTDITTESGPDADALLLDGPPPPNWHLASFTPDANWQPATDLGEPDDAYTEAPLIWAGTPSGAAEAALFRHTISPMLDTINSASLIIRANNRVESVYMNGELVGQVPASGDASGDSDPVEIVIDPSLIDPGGSNLLALHVVSSPVGGGDATAWVSYKLTLNGE